MTKKCELIFLLFLLLTSTLLTEDVPEFQFPCYVDVCTFPRQFCNSDKYERRCSPCTRGLCKASQVPTACRYICTKYDEESMTPAPSTTTTKLSAQQSSYQESSFLHSMYLIAAYCAIVITLIAVVLLLFIVYYVHTQKRAKKRKTTDPAVKYDKGKSYKQVNIELDEINREKTEGHTERKDCRGCIRPQPEISSDNTEDQRMNVNIPNSNPPLQRTRDGRILQTQSISTTQVKAESVENASSIPHKKLNNFYANTDKSDDKIVIDHKNISDSILTGRENETEETSLKSVSSKNSDHESTQIS